MTPNDKFVDDDDLIIGKIETRKSELKDIFTKI